MEAVATCTSSEVMAVQRGRPSAAVREAVIAVRTRHSERGMLDALRPKALLEEFCALEAPGRPVDDHAAPCVARRERSALTSAFPVSCGCACRGTARSVSATRRRPSRADGFSEPVKQPRRRSADGPEGWTAIAHPAPEPAHRGRRRRTPRTPNISIPPRERLPGGKCAPAIISGTSGEVYPLGPRFGRGARPRPAPSWPRSGTSSPAGHPGFVASAHGSPDPVEFVRQGPRGMRITLWEHARPTSA